MKKGYLHEKKFNMQSPNLKKEVDEFIEEVRSRMKEHGVTRFIAAHKQSGDMIHMVIIPCSGTPADQAQAQELLQAGFQAAEVGDTHQLKGYAATVIDPVSVEFSFGSGKKSETDSKPE